jgi:hypothetical protein
VEPTGHYRFISGIKIAHLCLKHRQGKKHKTRIVAFVDEKEMVKLAKKLKKEKVNIDMVNFGEDETNTNILNKFITTINGKEGTGSSRCPSSRYENPIFSDKIGFDCCLCTCTCTCTCTLCRARTAAGSGS